MNKQIVALALLALAACQLIEADQDADEKEVGLLLGNERLFAPHCLATRNDIIEDVRKRARETSSIVFDIFFGAASEIADDVLTAQREVVQELSQKLKDPSSTPVSDEPLPEDEVRELVEEGKKEIERRGLFGRFVQATQTATRALLSTANSALFVRLAKARSQMTATALMTGILHTCQQVAEYDSKLEKDLEVAKEAIKAENVEPEVVKFVEEFTVPALKCNTYKFIVRLNAFCDIFKNGGNAFLKMLGMSSQYKVPTLEATTTTTTTSA